MRDDAVSLFREISALQCQIRDHGPTPQRILRLASLTLRLGRPDQTHQHTTALVNGQSDPNLVREALWLDALAYCLEAAIAEGKAEGGTGLAIKADKAAEYRESAKILLKRLNKLPDPSAEEVALLRKVEAGGNLAMVENYIAGRPNIL